MTVYIAGFGLGGSAMALFGRIGGGIYTKAADVGADLIGKVESNLKEDSPRNPVTIADNVGDNVGDVIGMGSDLFGSFAEAICATLVLIASTEKLIMPSGSVDMKVLSYPFLISAAGIAGCFLTSCIGVCCFKVDNFRKISINLNLQLFLSTIFTLAICIGPIYVLPEEWQFKNDILNKNSDTKTATRWYAYIVTGLGLLAGYLIGVATNYYTSYAHGPVKEMAFACTSGPAINIIYGLALGYKSTIIPVIQIAITILVSVNLLGMLGVAFAAIGMLSTLSIGLAIDSYGPIAQNAVSIAEMVDLEGPVGAITEALDDSGNTSSSIGKGFAIGSATLVGLALYGAFVTRASLNEKYPIRKIDLNDPWIFGSLLIGAMIPFAFSALTMRSVAYAAEVMVKEVQSQFRDKRIIIGEKEPDYQKCISVSTSTSLKEMILPGLLVIITPIFFGLVFHPALVAGLLPGSLLSGVQLAISMSNTGGAWNNTKKYIESGKYVNTEGDVVYRGSDEHKAAVIGDTAGDPLKDTSGPSLNILIKFMAIIALVFVGGFEQTSWLSKPLKIQLE